MTQATQTLTNFLLARIDEEEAVVRDLLSAEWRREYRHSGPHMTTWSNPDYSEEGISLSPERVRAECEAKRRIVAEHGPVVNPLTPDITYCRMCVSGAGFGATSKTEDTGQIDPCRTLRLLASVYADHPDYRDEWRP